MHYVVYVLVELATKCCKVRRIMFSCVLKTSASSNIDKMKCICSGGMKDCAYVQVQRREKDIWLCFFDKTGHIMFPFQNSYYIRIGSVTSKHSINCRKIPNFKICSTL